MKMKTVKQQVQKPETKSVFPVYKRVQTTSIQEDNGLPKTIETKIKFKEEIRESKTQKEIVSSPIVEENELKYIDEVKI